MDDTLLETPRLRLRHFRTADAADVYAHCRDPELTRYTSWEHHTTPATAEGFIRAQRDHYARGSAAPLAIADRDTDRVLGAIGFYALTREDLRGEFGFWLGRAHWGQGLATEAAAAMVAHGLGPLGLVRVQAVCHVENLASARVLEKAGLALEGVMRRYAWKRGAPFDVRLYAAVAPARPAGPATSAP